MAFTRLFYNFLWIPPEPPLLMITASDHSVYFCYLPQIIITHGMYFQEMYSPLYFPSWIGLVTKYKIRLPGWSLA